MTDFTREKTKPANSVVLKEEMNGKHGWFEASMRYNLPTYYSGITFDSPRSLKTYEKYEQEKREIKWSNLEVESFSINREDIDAERRDIERKAKADGTWLKAPNGKDTNLSPKQWVDVRTKAFKEWFGDWEKVARIEKLRKASPIEITGNEVTPSEDLKQYRKNAEEYAKTLRGKYTNRDSGIEVELTSSRNNGGIREVLHHDYKTVAHLQSVAAIPQIIEESIYIASAPNIDNKVAVDTFDYYLCGLRINGEDYIVKSVLVTLADGTKYYDHKLTEFEKGKLLDMIAASTSNPISSESSVEAVGYPDIKDKRLISILQINSSKIVDENGEPKVVYHQTNGTVYINRETGENWDELDWQERDAWDERDDWEEYWEEQDFYTFSRVNARTTNELDGFFFAPEYDEYHEYGERTIPAFLNIRKPASKEDYNIDAIYNNAGQKERIRMQKEGYDGVVFVENDGRTVEYIAFEPNQIKSATENVGTYSAENADIRYSLNRDGITVATDEMVAEANKELTESQKAAKAIADEIEARIKKIAQSKELTFEQIEQLMLDENDNTAGIRRLVYIYNQAQGTKPKKTQAEADAAVEELREKYKLTIDEAKALLKERGTAYTAMREGTVKKKCRAESSALSLVGDAIYFSGRITMYAILLSAKTLAARALISS